MEIEYIHIAIGSSEKRQLRKEDQKMFFKYYLGVLFYCINSAQIEEQLPQNKPVCNKTFFSLLYLQVWPFSFQQQQQHQHQIQQSSQPQPVALKEPIIEPDIIRSTSNANPWFNREAALNMNSHYDQNYSYNDSYSYGKYPIRNSTTNNTNSTTAHG